MHAQVNTQCNRALPSHTKLINKLIYVFNKSTIPYSSVDNNDVYNGNKKKLINFVHI